MNRFSVSFLFLALSAAITSATAGELDCKAFDAAYWAAQAPEVRALVSVDDAEDRVLQATLLATQGFVVDGEIHAYGWRPCWVMKRRAMYGYTWYPSLLQDPPQIAPGLEQGNTPKYDPARPPAGSIKVSIDPADYPPFDQPAPTTGATKPKVLVGEHIAGAVYMSVTGDDSPDGTKYSDERGTFVKRSVRNPFGRSVFWERAGN